MSAAPVKTELVTICNKIIIIKIILIFLAVLCISLYILAPELATSCDRQLKLKFLIPNCYENYDQQIRQFPFSLLKKLKIKDF